MTERGVGKTPESDPAGGLWVVGAQSRDAVRDLFQAGPFWIQGMRKAVEILHWSKVFPDTRRLV